MTNENNPIARLLSMTAKQLDAVSKLEADGWQLDGLDADGDAVMARGNDWCFVNAAGEVQA